MAHDTHIEITGTIGDIFVHRFIVKRGDGSRLLADLGPKGVEAFTLREGQEVALTGAMKPSELKVSSIAAKGMAPVIIARHEKNTPHAEPEAAAKAVGAAGFTVLEPPRRKPKHFEVLARKNGIVFECHVEFSGTIRKEKAVEPGNAKWSSHFATVDCQSV